MAQNKFRTQFKGKKLKISLVIPNKNYAEALVKYLRYIDGKFKLVNEALLKSQFIFELNDKFDYNLKTIDEELILEIYTSVLLQDSETVLMGKKAYIAGKYCICNVEDLEISFITSNMYSNCSRIII